MQTNTNDRQEPKRMMVSEIDNEKRKGRKNVRWGRKSRAVIVTAPKNGSNSKRKSQKLVRVKSSMKFVTLDASLHSKYGEDSSSRTKSTEGASTSDRSVQWHEILVREYERVVGDNPSCSSGAPVSIGWRYNGPIIMTIDEYEESRPPRRNSSAMLLPRSVRQEMLMKEWGVPRSSVAAAVRNNVKTKNQRRRTVTNMNEKTERMESMVESAGRKFKRALLFKKRTSHEVNRLQEEASRAAEVMERISETDSVNDDETHELDEYEEEDEDGGAECYEEEESADEYYEESDQEADEEDIEYIIEDNDPADECYEGGEEYEEDDVLEEESDVVDCEVRGSAMAEADKASGEAESSRPPAKGNSHKALLNDPVISKARPCIIITEADD